MILTTFIATILASPLETNCNLKQPGIFGTEIPSKKKLLRFKRQFIKHPQMLVFKLTREALKGTRQKAEIMRITQILRCSPDFVEQVNKPSSVCMDFK